MIYFTSDSHYGHKNITRGTTEWVADNLGKKVRDFDTVEAMNDQMVKSFNELVQPDDILYHLGDWSFGGFDKIKEFRSRLNCKNIHLIYGNHDHHIERNKEGVQGLFKSVGYYKEITNDAGTKIILSHYGMRVWNHSHRGAWMLYGHSHGTLDQMTPTIANPTWIGDDYYIKNWRTMDVGVDTNDLKPYSMEELKTKLNNKSILLGVDHHNLNTTL
jgi:calcineurin-like phosphoesterase family protein